MRAEGLLGVILPKDRDPRFVTIRRGGTLADSDHQLLALWAASCAEHVLDLFESARPEDPRPRQAIEQARAWVCGEITMSQARRRPAMQILRRAGQRPRTCPAAIHPSSNAAVPVVTTGSCAAKSRSACSSSVSTTARPYESSSVRIGPNTTMSPRSRYGRQWAAWRFMISRSASVRLWAKSGRGAIRRRTKAGMPRTLRRLLVAIEWPAPARGRQLARRDAPMAAMGSSCVVI